MGFANSLKLFRGLEGQIMSIMSIGIREVRVMVIIDDKNFDSFIKSHF